MFALEVVATARKDNLKCFTVQYLSKFLLNWYLWKTAWSICSSHFFRSLGLNSGYATELSVALKKKKKRQSRLQGCLAFLRAQGSGWNDSDTQEPGSESQSLSSASWGRPRPPWAGHLHCAGSCWTTALPDLSLEPGHCPPSEISAYELAQNHLGEHREESSLGA